MAQSTKRAVNDEEEDLISEEIETDVRSSGAVVSDSRRRRMIARGEDPDALSAATTASKNRPTPSQRQEAKEEGGNFIVKGFRDLRNYFIDVRGELLKVAWPTRAEALRLTYIVIAVTAIAAIFLGTVSYLFSLLTTQVAAADTSTLFGLLTIVGVIIVTGAWLLRDRLFGRYDS